MKRKSRILGFVFGLFGVAISSFYFNWRLGISSILAFYLARLICFDLLNIHYFEWIAYVIPIFFALFNVYLVGVHNELTDEIRANQDEITMAEYEEYKKGLNSLYLTVYPRFIFDWVFSIYCVGGLVTTSYYIIKYGNWIKGIIIIIAIPLFLALTYKLIDFIIGAISIIFLIIHDAIHKDKESTDTDHYTIE